MKRFSLFALLLLVSTVCGQEVPGDAQYAIFMGDNGVVVLKFDVLIAGKGPRGVDESLSGDWIG